jgi:putative ubiquitin-RnfH superfamily antitoxin RatB of RatAB toxin-antitoxin module
MENNMLQVFVSYALPEQQWIETLQVPAGSAIKDVLQMCDKFPFFADLDLSQHKIGIYGVVVTLEHQVQAGDRIEIYRPLIVDPMTARRLRVVHRKSKKTQRSE